MSGLEKFQASEAWRRNFKKFLFMERKPEIVKSASTTESQRYSLDIAEDLKSIIEQKKSQKTVAIHSKEDIANSSKMSGETCEPAESEVLKNMNMNPYDESAYEEVPMWQKTSDESFENLEKMCEKTVSDTNSTLFKYLNGEAEEKSNNVFVWQKNSDESFEALERMCDKTASDPNSTLFKYLHTDQKEEILAAVKKRSTDAQDAEDQLLNKINNCTLLEDVEAPSRMWENTICGDSVLQTSPVKMVGLLRPSTIMEETPDDSTNSDISSHVSFQTASKSSRSDVSSSAYDTAHDSTHVSNKTDLSKKFRTEEPKENDIQQALLLVNLDKHETENLPSFATLENTIVEPATLSSKSDAESNVSDDLIDLEKTFGPAQYSCQALPLTGCSSRNESSDGEEDFENKSNSFNLLDESVIELISDEEDDSFPKVPNVVEDIHTKSEITSTTSGTNDCTYTFNETNDDDKENNLETSGQSRKSMQFNDTMEEVEYLLRRGMEYMAAGGAVRKTPEKVNISQSESTIVKEKKAEPASSYSASKAKITPLNNKGPGSSSRRFDMDIKPFPKLDIFAKPIAHARKKELATKQQKFSHIISPIGTYMKKTAQTPLMSSINCKTKDYFTSAAVMELENESRLYKPLFQPTAGDDEAKGLPKLPGLDLDAKRPLPKKAYISSDLKHIVDERTPITIPASKKIQKYLENAMMPAVLRHDGKFKVPGGIVDKFSTSAAQSAAPSKTPLKESDTNSVYSNPITSHKPHRNNASLADLSVMSGDVSMYTIMDAQKF